MDAINSSTKTEKEEEEKRKKEMTLNGRNWEEFFSYMIIFSFSWFSLHCFLCCIQFKQRMGEWESITGWHNKIIHYYIIFYRGWEFVYEMGSDKSQNIDIIEKFFFLAWKRKRDRKWSGRDNRDKIVIVVVSFVSELSTGSILLFMKFSFDFVCMRNLKYSIYFSIRLNVIDKTVHFWK